MVMGHVVPPGNELFRSPVPVGVDVILSLHEVATLLQREHGMTDRFGECEVLERVIGETAFRAIASRLREQLGSPSGRTPSDDLLMFYFATGESDHLLPGHVSALDLGVRASLCLYSSVTVGCNNLPDSSHSLLWRRIANAVNSEEHPDPTARLKRARDLHERYPSNVLPTVREPSNLLDRYVFNRCHPLVVPLYEWVQNNNGSNTP